VTVLLNVLLVLFSFAIMELVAWSSHKYLMHSMLWFMHRDHHQRDDNSFFERNDLFFIVFATPGILLIYLGFVAGPASPLLWIGSGISLYGMAYVFVHDIAVHQRIRLFRKLDNRYLRAIRKAHKVHHKYQHKEDAENFGFLWVPAKYLKEARG